MRTTASSLARACILSVVGPGIGFREIEPLALLRFAEVRRVEELLEADDLRPTTGRIPDQPFGTRHSRRGIGVRVILNDANGKRSGVGVSHSSDYTVGVRPGSDQGQTRVRPGSDRGQTGVRPGQPRRDPSASDADVGRRDERAHDFRDASEKARNASGGCNIRRQRTMTRLPRRILTGSACILVVGAVLLRAQSVPSAPVNSPQPSASGQPHDRLRAGHPTDLQTVLCRMPRADEGPRPAAAAHARGDPEGRTLRPPRRRRTRAMSACSCGACLASTARIRCRSMAIRCRRRPSHDCGHGSIKVR